MLQMNFKIKDPVISFKESSHFSHAFYPKLFFYTRLDFPLRGRKMEREREREH